MSKKCYPFKQIIKTYGNFVFFHILPLIRTCTEKFCITSTVYNRYVLVFRKEYAFGVNEVTKSLEKSKLQAVLIASDVSPRLLVKHVVDMCIIKNVPILVIPELRQSLQRRFGVSAVVFGVKSNDFLVEVLKKVHVNYPVPKDHIHYLRMLEHDVEKDSDSVVVEEVQMEESDDDEKEDVNKVLYLYRTSKRERVFKPAKSEGKFENAAAVSKPDVGFVSLDDGGEKTDQKSNYKALIVKRLKGNKDREKRKREIMIQKKKKGK